MGYMFWFLIHSKAAWCYSNDDLKKVAWKAWALLCYFVQPVHTSSASHSHFDKHLIMPRISRLHPLCVAIMPPKKIYAFCGQWALCPCAEYNKYNSLLLIISFSQLRASHSHGSHMALWSCLSHRLQVKTDTSGMQLCVSLSNSEAHIEDFGRTVHIYFSSNYKMSRPNEHQKH